MTDRDAFLAWVNTVLLEAEVSLHNGDANPRRAIWFELQACDVVGDMAYTAGPEHTSTSVNGTPSSYTLRATQVYRRENGEWKVAHRHAETVSG